MFTNHCRSPNMKPSITTVITLLFIASANSACAQNPVIATAQAASLPTTNTALPVPATVVVPVTTAAPAAPTIPAAPTQVAAINPEYEAFFDEAVQLINQYRASKKLSPLSRDRRLDGIASTHSRYMAAKDDLSHDGFNERFNQANMHSCAENVAWNQITASELVNDWIASPVHDKNLLKPNVTRVGMGRAKGYTAYFVCQP
jgi:uncharacterized protein YkwD